MQADNYRARKRGRLFAIGCPQISGEDPERAGLSNSYIDALFQRFQYSYEKAARILVCGEDDDRAREMDRQSFRPERNRQALRPNTQTGFEAERQKYAAGGFYEPGARH